MSDDCAPVRLDAVDAVELAELLEFLADWLDHHADRRVEHSLALFSGYGYDTHQLRADLARFVFLLGGDGCRLLHGDGA